MRESDIVRFRVSRSARRKQPTAKQARKHVNNLQGASPLCEIGRLRILDSSSNNGRPRQATTSESLDFAHYFSPSASIDESKTHWQAGDRKFQNRRVNLSRSQALIRNRLVCSRPLSPLSERFSFLAMVWLSHFTPVSLVSLSEER